MSTKIINTSVVSKYWYDTGAQVITKGPIEDSAENTFNQAAISFLKVCSPHYIDVGDPFQIEYILCNKTEASTPMFDRLAVNDPFLKMQSYMIITSTVNVQGAIDQASGKFEVDLSAVGGKLDPGECITVTLYCKCTTLPPTGDYFVTTATGDFIGGGQPLHADSTCGSEVGNGDLTITKETTTPDPVSSGTVIHYVITISNIGNVVSTINAGDFTDAPPLSQLQDIMLVAPVVPGIIFDGTKIVNTTDISINPSDQIVIYFDATVI